MAMALSSACGTGPKPLATRSPSTPDQSTTTSAGSPPASSSPASSANSTTASPGASATSTPTAAPMIPLTRDVDLPRPPIWGFTKTEGWDVVVFDSQGRNQLKNAAGCILTTLQQAGTIADIPGSIPGVNDQRPTDATATKRQLEQMVAEAQPQARDFAVGGPPWSLPMTFGQNGAQRIEFAAIDVTYVPKAGGQQTHTLLAARLMPRPASQLLLDLTCPAGAFEAGRSILGQLRVLAG